LLRYFWAQEPQLQALGFDYHSSGSFDSDWTAGPSASLGGAGYPTSDGLDDVLIVLRTSATEIYEKLPIHLATTFARISNYLVYSDVEQDLGELEVHDALSHILKDLREQHSDLAQYRALQQHISTGGNAAELGEENSRWLDKWKFLPMIRDAYHRFGAQKK
ncbi:hypothetical protein LTR53_019070, partial [Teratosphaeriaceae sp. CCFEE 6253]